MNFSLQIGVEEPRVIFATSNEVLVRDEGGGDDYPIYVGPSSVDSIAFSLERQLVWVAHGQEIVEMEDGSFNNTGKRFRCSIYSWFILVAANNARRWVTSLVLIQLFVSILAETAMAMGLDWASHKWRVFWSIRCLVIWCHSLGNIYFWTESLQWDALWASVSSLPWTRESIGQTSRSYRGHVRRRRSLVCALGPFRSSNSEKFL